MPLPSLEPRNRVFAMLECANGSGETAAHILEGIVIKNS